MSDADNPEAGDKLTAPLPLVNSSRPHQAAPSSEPTVRAVPKRKSSPPPPKHEAGARIDRYVIEKILGRGGMAEVYQAHDPRLKRKVALKILHGDQKMLQGPKRLLFEAQAAANFQHPNSVIIYDVGEHGDDTFIAMELIRGRRLSEYARDPTVPLPRKLRWLVSIARALASAHRKGLVHRDIKPANVMIRDEDSEAKVLDFGIARSVFPEGELDGDITDQGQMVGTIRYAAPEQIRGEHVDGRADQFSWGITAYLLLSGRMPFLEQDTMAVASKVAFEEVPSLSMVAPELPEEVIAVIDRAIAAKPDDRFATMDDAADALEMFAEGSPAHQRASNLPPQPASVPDPHATPPTPATPGSPTPFGSSRPTEPSSPTLMSATETGSRRGWFAVVGGAVGLAAALALFVALRPTKSEAPATPAPARVAVPAVRCAPASVTGEPDPEIAKALGVAACARLGIEIGVPWGSTNEAAHVVKTTVTMGPEVQATVEVGGRTEAGKGSTPIQAVSQAITSLAGGVSPPALSEREVKAWGAKDEAGARRIERAWRTRSLWMAGDGAAQARSLLETDADSPIPHLMLLMSAGVGREAADAASKRIAALADRLPTARESMVEGLLSVLPEETNRTEAVKLLRIAYAAAPDDADVAAIFSTFAVRWGLPEGYGALDRLTTSAPTRSIFALENALVSPPKRDLDRIDRYAAKVREIFPEARGAPSMVRALVTRGKIDEARAALAFARKLGLNRAPADPLVHAESSLWVELAAGNAAEARKIALEILGDPGPLWQMIGGHGVASSHLLEGQAARAEAALWAAADRHRGMSDEKAAVAFAVRALMVRRILKQLPVEPSRLDWLRAALGKGSRLPPAARAEGLVEVALAQTGLETFRVRTETLTEVEAVASALLPGDVMLRHEILVKTIPLVRALRGDRPAIERWKATEEAPFTSRLRPALDAALAMEAIGDLRGAYAAYQISEDAWNLREGMLERVISMYKIGRLSPRIGLMAEGAARKKTFEGLWANMEPAARTALELIR